MKKMDMEELQMERGTDKKVVEHLSQYHAEYKALYKNKELLCEKYPKLKALIYGDDTLELSAEEHRMFMEYMDMEHQMNWIEKKFYYYLGSLSLSALGNKIRFLLDEGLSEEKKSEEAERQNMLFDILTEGFMEDLEQNFLSADKENEEREKRILELEAQVKSLELPEEMCDKIDEYVSAINSQWLECSAFAYQCGMKDILTLIH